jgi:hypothetical protein
MEKDYGKAVDIWSAGVIFGELLKTIEEHCPIFEERTCLFPGNHCFPLSPNRKKELDNDGIPKNGKDDQLEFIFDIIGSPKSDDISFVTDEKARIYLTRFKPREPADL